MNRLQAAIGERQDHRAIIAEIGETAAHLVLVDHSGEFLPDARCMRKPGRADVGKALALAPDRKPMRQ